MSYGLIIDKYVSVINEYMELIAESKYMNETSTLASSMYIGMNSLHRVFEYVILKTKNIEKACHYSKKTFYYYLEYMEQINSSNLCQNLNHMDAVLFVYRKTIFDLYDGEPEDSYNTMTNIIVSNEESILMDDVECRAFFTNISKFVNTLFYWENESLTFSERKELCATFLLPFLQQVNILDKTTRYLDFIQKKEKLLIGLYTKLLKEILESIGKRKKTRSNDFDTSDYLQKCFVEFDLFHEKLTSGNMSDLVNWLNP
uniref:Uncharacterized protein n=1 Tax=viral metagenome TaxID=1070528 RepID=A0A6C0JGX7_9ZZZZ